MSVIRGTTVWCVYDSIETREWWQKSLVWNWTVYGFSGLY